MYHTADRVQATSRERERAMHPDLNGGSDEAMSELNAARDVALREVRA